MINKRKNLNKRTSFGMIEKIFQYLAFSILSVKNCLFLTTKALQTVNILSFHLKTIFLISIFLGAFSQAQAVKCRNAFSSPHSPSDFSSAMSKNLLLNKKQSSLLNIYVNSWFEYAVGINYEYEVEKIFDTLEKYPELSKLPLREYQLVFLQKEEKKLESLTRFLKSFNSSAGRIRNNLFQIEANWGLWAKALSSAKSKNINSNSTSSSAQSNSKLNSKSNSNSKTPSNKTPDTTFESKNNNPSLSNAEKKELKEKEKQQFLEYLETTPLNKELRQSILAKPKNSEENFSAYSEENLESPVLDYREKIIAFYQALSALRENFQDNSKAFDFLSQTMSDLVHISGFGNPFYSELLKSRTPSENIKGVHNILSERDSIAKELGFKKGFSELQSSLNIKHRDKFAEQLNAIEKEMENNQSAFLEKESLKLRPLSLFEAPFRGCLGNDCSTMMYFDLALDPNYLYFTLTNSRHQSSGYVSIVLGQAKKKYTKNEIVNVAFIDKIQAIPIEKITAVLEGIRLSLEEQGYKLALSKDVGNHSGLSNELRTRKYIEEELFPNLKTEFNNFKPFKHQYVFNKGFSRAFSHSTLLEFDLWEGKDSVKIQPEDIQLPKKASKNLNMENIYGPILAMKDSKKEEEQILFLKNLPIINNNPPTDSVRKFLESDREEYLFSIIKNSAFSFKVRKNAFFTFILLTENNKLDSSFLEHQLESFSEKESQLILGEMSNWKNSRDPYKKYFISNLHFRKPFKEFQAFLESPLKVIFDVNIQNEDGNTLLMLRDGIEEVQQLIKAGANPNIKNIFEQTPLMLAVQARKLDIVNALLDANADPNIVNSKGNTPLMEAIMLGQLDICKALLEAGANVNAVDKNGQVALIYTINSIFTDTTKLLVQANADVNVVDKNGNIALILAVKKGNLPAVEAIVSAKPDLNAVDKDGNTALMHATEQGLLDIVNLLIKEGADVNLKNHKGNTPLMLNFRRYQGLKRINKRENRLDILETLISAGANINLRNKQGKTALTIAKKYKLEHAVKILMKERERLNLNKKNKLLDDLNLNSEKYKGNNDDK